MAESQSEEKQKSGFHDAGGSAGYISMDQAGVFAIRHATDNKHFYGSKYAHRNLTFEVIDAEEGEDNYYIRLSYRPCSPWSGLRGIELFTVNKIGTIEARQIIEEPADAESPPLFGSQIRFVIRTLKNSLRSFSQPSENQ